MSRPTYKGIEFREGYDLPFADFKKEFENTHIFKSIPHKDVDAELKKAYKIATNGNIPKSTKSSAKTKPETD